MSLFQSESIYMDSVALFECEIEVVSVPRSPSLFLSFHVAGVSLNMFLANENAISYLLKIVSYSSLTMVYCQLLLLLILNVFLSITSSI